MVNASQCYTKRKNTKGVYMHSSWIVLVPPCIILLTAIASRNLILSVLLGITSATFIATDYSIIGTGSMAFNYFYRQLSWDNINLFGFLIVLGIIISLINATGGTCAFSNFITRHVQSKRTIESSSLTVSLFFGIDDYLNALTTGCIIKPLTDKLKIPRVKLAYLLNIMASPLVVLVPISSWSAFIVSQLSQSGINQQATAIINADPLFTYLRSIPFIFYSLIVIASAWLIVRKRISYGPMSTHETIAQTSNNLYGGKQPRFNDATIQTHAHSSLSDFMLPILLLIASTIFGILQKGGYYMFGGNHSFFQAFCHTGNAIFIALMNAACITLILSSLWALVRKRITLPALGKCFVQGVLLMYQSVTVVFCALMFSAIIVNELHTGDYLAQLILPGINAALLPLIIFIITICTALSTGSSWGAMSITIPISVPLVHAFIHASPTILIATIGAIISGAIAGAQLSPISDPVTVASASAGCYQLDHVKTQTPYIIPVILGSCIAFAASGFINIGTPTITAITCLALGLTSTFAVLLAANYWWNRVK